MLEDILVGLTIAAALGCGLNGGVLYGFSAFIMRGLAKPAAPYGMRAMQSINMTALNPWFMAPFFGTAVACFVLIIHAVADLKDPDAVYLLSGGSLYLAGVIVITIAFNVPLNDRLATVDPDSPEGAEIWHQYLLHWTRWNTVRAATGLAASAAYIAALLV